MAQTTLANYDIQKIDPVIADKIQRIDQLIKSNKYPIAKESLINEKDNLLVEIARQRKVKQIGIRKEEK